jgi:hypothetical protein
MTDAAQRTRVFPACKQMQEVFASLLRNAWLRSDTGAVDVVRSWAGLRRGPASQVVLVFEAAQIDKPDWVRQVRSLKNKHKSYLVFAGGVPFQGIPERLARLDVRDPRRIHLVQAETPGCRLELLERLLAALNACQADDERVLDAWWEDDVLVVLSPRFRRLHVPLEKLRPLRGMTREQRGRFEIDEAGAFLHWSDGDVHLGWEQFAQAVDEGAYLKARQKSQEFNRCYGTAIRRLRVKRGLRQSDIRGLTPRQVGRVERGECRATHAALEKLAKANGMSTSDYMAALAELLVQGAGCVPARAAR